MLAITLTILSNTSRVSISAGKSIYSQMSRYSHRTIGAARPKSAQPRLYDSSGQHLTVSFFRAPVIFVIVRFVIHTATLHKAVVIESAPKHRPQFIVLL